MKRDLARTGGRGSEILKRHDIMTAVAASKRKLFQSDYMFKPRMIGLVTWAVEFSSSGHMTRWLSFDRKENKHFPQRFLDPLSWTRLCIRS